MDMHTVRKMTPNQITILHKLLDDLHCAVLSAEERLESISPRIDDGRKIPVTDFLFSGERQEYLFDKNGLIAGIIEQLPDD